MFSDERSVTREKRRKNAESSGAVRGTDAYSKNAPYSPNAASALCVFMEKQYVISRSAFSPRGFRSTQRGERRYLFISFCPFGAFFGGWSASTRLKSVQRVVSNRRYRMWGETDASSGIHE